MREGHWRWILYSGVGFFTLPLAKTFQKVVSVDANLAATRDLYANAEAAGVAITSHNEHVEEFLKKTEEKAGLCDSGSAARGTWARRQRKNWRSWAPRKLCIFPAILPRWRAIWRC